MRKRYIFNFTRYLMKPIFFCNIICQKYYICFDILICNKFKDFMVNNEIAFFITIFILAFPWKSMR